MKLFPLFFIVLFSYATILFSCCQKEKIGDPIDLEEPEELEEITYDETGCLYTSYTNLVMAGYQGWFAAEGDDSDRGWYH